MQNLQYSESISGCNIKGEFTFNKQSGTFRLLLDLFILKTDGIENIERKIKDEISKNNYSLQEETLKSCNRYAKAIFYNIKKVNKEANNQSKPTREITLTEKIKHLNPIQEIISAIENKQYYESAYYIESEIRINIGRRDDVSKYINILVLVMSFIDIEFIDKLYYVDTEIIILCRIKIEINNNEQFSQHEEKVSNIVKDVYTKLIDSLKYANDLVDKLIIDERSLALLNQIFEVKTGFTTVKNIKRIKDEEFQKLLQTLFETLESLNIGLKL